MRFATPGLPANSLLRLYVMIPHGRDWMQILFHIHIVQPLTRGGVVSLSEEKGEVMLCWFLRFISSFLSFSPAWCSLFIWQGRHSTLPGPSAHAFSGLPSWGKNWQEIGALEEGRYLSPSLPLSLPQSHFWHCLFLLGLRNSWAASPWVQLLPG